MARLDENGLLRLCEHIKTMVGSADGGSASVVPGSGLGGLAPKITTKEEMDAFRVTGWREVDLGPNNGFSVPGGYDYSLRMRIGILACEASDSMIIQTYTDKSFSLGMILQRRFYPLDSEPQWSEWYWVTPPMVTNGVDSMYLTTELFNGRKVFYASMDIGEFPSAGHKDISLAQTWSDGYAIADQVNGTICDVVDVKVFMLYTDSLGPVIQVNPEDIAVLKSQNVVRIMQTFEGNNCTGRLLIKFTVQ